MFYTVLYRFVGELSRGLGGVRILKKREELLLWASRAMLEACWCEQYELDY